MKSVVSVRGQTVIPREIREALGIKAGSRLVWELEGKSIIVYPLPDDPVAASLGLLKGAGYSFDDFIAERNEERARERAQDKEEERGWRATSSTPRP